MHLLQKISKDIHSSMEEFCKQVSLRYKIDEEELNKMWMDMSEFQGITRSKGKTSNYMVFTKSIRSKIIDEHPEYSFGEISTEIARRWKNLSIEEKNAYGVSIDAKENLTKKYKSMKVKDLKDLCKKYHISTLGKKKELIERLETYESSDKNESTPSSSTTDDDSPLPVLSPESVIDDIDEVEKNSPTVDDEETSESENVNYEKMTVKELKEICKKRKLSTKGSKKELIFSLTT